MKKVRCSALLFAMVFGLSIFFGNAFATSNSPKKIVTIQPRLTIEELMSPSTLQGVVNDLVSKFSDKLEYIDEYEYKDIITTEAMKKLGRDEIILWRGHGDWYNDEEPVLRTGRDFNEEEAEEGVIVDVDVFYEAITTKYIDRYVGDLSGSLVYLDVCESARNSKLAETFLRKGAETVLGSTNTAEMTYSNNVQDMVVALLGEINPETEDYYTISEALAKAKNEYGETDPGSGGEIKIFGNENYRIFSTKTEEKVPSAPNTGFSSEESVVMENLSLVLSVVIFGGVWVFRKH